MCFPLAHRVAAGHTADIKDELPQLLDGRIGIEVGEHLLRPRCARHGSDGPLDPVVHGVLPPRGHEFPVGGVHPADLGAVQPGVDLRIIGDEVQHTDAAFAFGVIQIAAQLVRLEVRQGLLAAQFHAAAGNGIVVPVHLHIPRPGLKGAADAQPGQRSRLQRAADDQSLARLGVHSHPDNEIGIFFQQFVEVFHESSFPPCKNGTQLILCPVYPFSEEMSTQNLFMALHFLRCCAILQVERECCPANGQHLSTCHTKMTAKCARLGAVIFCCQRFSKLHRTCQSLPLQAA